MSGLTRIDTVSHTEPVWMFGYGSLIWKVNFPYQEKMVGYVNDFARRFWQGSTDHRGTPEAPGRVATLIQSKGDITWGIAYKVSPEDVPETVAYLNHREIDGYKMHRVNFYPAMPNQPMIEALLYIATENNPSYLGPLNKEALAKHIINSKGPSGCNVEYVLKLAEGMREIAPTINDDHLFPLEAKIKELLLYRKMEATNTEEVFCTCSYCS